MYGFGVESGTLYYKSGGNHDFYRSKNRDGTPNGTLRAGSYSGDGSLLTGIASSAQGVLADNSVQLTGETTQTIEGNIITKHTGQISDALKITHNSNDVFLQLFKRANQSTPDIFFRTSGNSYINAGNLGINTTTPTERLDVVGNVKATNFIGSGSQLTEVVKTSGSQEVGGFKRFTSDIALANTDVINTLKIGRLDGYTYAQSSRFIGMYLVGLSGSNNIIIGGGTGGAKSATQITLATNSDPESLSSTNRVLINHLKAEFFVPIIGDGSQLTGVASAAQGALADNSVQLNGNQTIEGVKTFNDIMSASGIFSTEGNVIRVPNPKGGSSGNLGNANSVGAIKIRLPKKGSSTMLSFVVDIYDYVNNRSVSLFISGYDHTSQWLQTTAKILSENTSQDYNVRFGHDGTYSCVWIGELSTTWQYPKVIVRDFLGGFSNVNSGWAENWQMSRVTSFDTVQTTKIGNLVASDFNKLKNLSAASTQLVLGNGTGINQNTFASAAQGVLADNSVQLTGETSQEIAGSIVIKNNLDVENTLFADVLRVTRTSGIEFANGGIPGSSIKTDANNTVIISTRLPSVPYTELKTIYINTAGNVGIATGTPSYKLDVSGEGRFTGDLRCLSLIQTSQRNQKKEIVDIQKTTGKKIDFKQFKYIDSIDGSNRKRYGVVVEDIEGEYPELVYTGVDGVKGVNYIDLLIKRVAELEKELEDATGGVTTTQTIVVDGKGNTKQLVFVNGLLQEISK
jgi:hypothetical protein